MPTIKVYALIACLPLLAVACGGTDETVASDGLAVTCDPSTFRLAGTIDGTSIDVREPAGGGFDQLDTGEFQSLDSTSDPDPTTTDLRLAWAHSVDDGQTTTATGTLHMPSSAFPNDVFCAGKDTTLEVETDAEGGGLQFHLQNLTSGAGCATPRAGALEGCWRP